jgi:hypothetical protein
LLELHRNVTKAQQQLFQAMDTSVGQVWSAIGDQKDFIGGWKTFLGGVKDDLDELEHNVVGRLRLKSQELQTALSGLFDIATASQAQHFQALEKLNSVWTGLSTISIARHSLTTLVQAFRESDNMVMRAAGKQQIELAGTLQSIEHVPTYSVIPCTWIHS